MQALWVYAIGDSIRADSISADIEGIEGKFTVVSAAGLAAFCSIVDGERFSQEELDRHASDLAWIGEIGFRHQTVISHLSRGSNVIPLRAFTLFAGADSLRAFLEKEEDSLKKILDGLRGKEEWTLRLEFDPEKWAEALVRRVPSLRQLDSDAAGTSAGKGYLLRKKLEEERKKTARTAEEDVLKEVEDELTGHFGAPTLVEDREQRSGSFPQINLLLDRSRAQELRDIHREIAARYENDGVNIVLTGPWPPYSFASVRTHGN